MTLRPDCGTPDGWKRHQQQKTTPCPGCTEAQEHYLAALAEARRPTTGRRQKWADAKEALGIVKPASCPLTEPEWCIAVLVTRGLGDGDIATQQALAPSSVKSHLRRIYMRLGITTRAQLSVLMYRHGWLAADLAEEGGQVTMPRELYRALRRIAHLAQYGRGAEAQSLARRVAAQLPAPRTYPPGDDQKGG